MPAANTSPPWWTMISANTIAGIATTIRGARSDPVLRSRRSATPTAPEPAPARGVLVERRLERLAREVRPQLVAEHELRVGDLPEQVVRDAQLAARADQEVGIVHVGRVQVAAELFLRLSREGSRRVHDLRPAAVVERHEQRDAIVARRQLLRPVHPPRELVA